MKFRVTFKDPDGPMEDIADAADGSEELEEEMWRCINRWLLFKEYVYVEFDTVADTATVIRPDEM